MIRFSVSVGALLFSFLGFSMTVDAADSALASKVINGAEVPIEEVPGIVALYSQEEDGRRFICGGTQIAPNKILTAAHCVVDEDGEVLSTDVLTVVASVSDLSEPVTPYAVNAITVHPDYRPKTVLYDAAVITLTTAIVFPQPVTLGGRHDERKSEVLVAGWGSTDYYGGSLSQRLMRGYVEVLPQARCHRLLANGWGRAWAERSDLRLCGRPNPSSICDGDSGGPLFVRKNGALVQIGIVSIYLPRHDIDCANSGYTRISAPVIKRFIDANR